MKRVLRKITDCQDMMVTKMIKESQLSLSRLVIGFVFALLWVGPALAQPVVSPARGSALRADVLDALRPTVERETDGPVIFVVNTLNVMGDWAYVDTDPRRPSGGKIDWRRTKFRDAFEADMFSGLVLALLRRQGGHWRVVETAIGPTDVAWVEWATKHKLPKALFQKG